MKKIHRKSQMWLYQKYKQDTAEKEPRKVILDEADNRQENLYFLLELSKYIIPLLMLLLGIELVR